MSAQGGDLHSHHDEHGRASNDSVGGDDAQCGKSMDSGSGANSSDPSTRMGPRRRMDATS